MKKTLLYLVAAVLAAGCARNIELTEPLNAERNPRVECQPRTRSLDGAVYNKIVDAWMIAQPDPYSLANFQAAYDKLAAGKSTQKLTKSLAAEFTVVRRLTSTHYALKIYPRTEEEQWRVEMMEDVQVAYIPFGYARLTQDEVDKLPASKSASGAAAKTFTEKSPYSVTYDYTEVTDGGPTGPQTFQLPILYTVWPIGKSLPTDLEYVIDYEVFLPRAVTGTKTSDALDILEREAVSPMSGLSSAVYPEVTLRKYLMTYDNALGKNVPLANLKIQVQKGSNISYISTDSNGMFSIVRRLPLSWDEYTLTAIYQDNAGRWTIVPVGSFIPCSTEVWPPNSDLEVERVGASACQEAEIHRAVNYFYNVQNDFPIPVTNNQQVIRAYSGLDPSDNSPTRRGICYYGGAIHIYNIAGDTHGWVVGATLHELAHALQFSIAPYTADNRYTFFTEAFASYVGWCLGEEYYKSQGWSQNSALEITGTSWQDWTNTSVRYYTPFLIDLTDTYNQSSLDAFQNFPLSNVMYIAYNIRTWTECASYLRSYYNNSQQINNYLDYYYVWIKNNLQYVLE